MKASRISIEPRYARQAKLFKKIRLSLKLCQMDMALGLGYTSQQFISNIERGKAQIPHSILVYLHKQKGVDINKLIRAIVKDYEEYLRQSVNYTL